MYLNNMFSFVEGVNKKKQKQEPNNVKWKREGEGETRDGNGECGKRNITY